MFQAMERERDLGIFLSHLKEAGLTTMLDSDDEEDKISSAGFTLFAPTDRAWAKANFFLVRWEVAQPALPIFQRFQIPRKDLRDLLRDEEALLALLQRHIGTKEVFAKDILPKEGESSRSILVPTLGGEYVSVSGSRNAEGSGERVRVMSSVTAAEVKEKEIVASNGVIHIVGTVL